MYIGGAARNFAGLGVVYRAAAEHARRCVDSGKLGEAAALPGGAWAAECDLFLIGFGIFADLGDEYTAVFLHTIGIGFGGGIGAAALFYCAFSILCGGHEILRGAGAELAGPRSVRAICDGATRAGGHAHAGVSGVSGRYLFFARARRPGRNVGAGVFGFGDLRFDGFDCGAAGGGFAAEVGGYGGFVDGGDLSFYGELHSRRFDGILGDIFDGFGDFCVGAYFERAGGDGFCCWRFYGAAEGVDVRRVVSLGGIDCGGGDFGASGGAADFGCGGVGVVLAMEAPGGLGTIDFGGIVDGRGFGFCAAAVGGAERADFGTD